MVIKAARAMNRWLTLILALGLTGCAQPKPTAPESRAAPIVGFRPPTRSIAEFSFIGPSTTVEAAVTRLGSPDATLCVSTGYEYALIYFLADESSVVIHTDGRSRILSVRHGATVLFEQSR